MNLRQHFEDLRKIVFQALTESATSVADLFPTWRLFAMDLSVERKSLFLLMP